MKRDKPKNLISTIIAAILGMSGVRKKFSGKSDYHPTIQAVLTTGGVRYVNVPVIVENETGLNNGNDPTKTTDILQLAMSDLDLASFNADCEDMHTYSYEDELPTQQVLGHRNKPSEVPVDDVEGSNLSNRRNVPSTSGNEVASLPPRRDQAGIITLVPKRAFKRKATRNFVTTTATFGEMNPGHGTPSPPKEKRIKYSTLNSVPVHIRSSITRTQNEVIRPSANTYLEKNEPSCQNRIEPQHDQAYVEKLQKQIVQLRKEKKTLGQKVRRQSVKLAEAKIIMASDQVKKWDKLSDTQKLFIELQLQNTDKRPQGRRYTQEQKVLGLNLYKRSPSYYNFLTSNFTLPGATTVNAVLDKVPCSTGLTEIVFEKLKKVSETMDPQEKYCILMWDEMKLMLHLQEDESEDQLSGFEDWGYKRTAKFADHALVFILKGIKSEKILTVFHGYCQFATKTAELKRCIKLVTKAVEKVGFKIVAFVCDQSSSNRTATAQLITESNAERVKNNEPVTANTIKISNTVVTVIPDPPHTMKCIRNNFQTKHLELDVNWKSDKLPEDLKPEKKLAKWPVIQKCFKIDQTSHGLRPIMSNLTEHHINEKKVNKMRVKHAVQVLSKTVAKCIRSFTETGTFLHFCQI